MAVILFQDYIDNTLIINTTFYDLEADDFLTSSLHIEEPICANMNIIINEVVCTLSAIGKMNCCVCNFI